MPTGLRAMPVSLMRKINRLFLSILFLLSTVAFAKTKQAVIFGGGGEPLDKPDTIFDETYRDYVSGMTKSNWNASSFFDSGHPETEKMVATLAKNNQPFTQKNFDRYIASLKKEIQSGKLKSGDQLYIQISTHGSPQVRNEYTHQVSTVDGSVDMSELKKLRDLAEAKGVKLGIVDMSCHSGATLALASSKTCVVSMAASNVSLNTDGESFAEQIAPGRSLEEVFLRGRENNSSSGFPQISTSAGKMTGEVLRDIQKNNDYVGSAAVKDCHLMTTPDTFKRLLANLDAIEKKNPTYSILGLKYQGSGAGTAKKKLVDAIQDYESRRMDLVASFQAAEKLDQSICVTENKKKVCPRFHHLEEIIHIMDKMKMNTPERGQYEKTVKSPAFARWKKARKTYEERLANLKTYSDKVGKTERAVYGLLYKDMAERSAGPNPCKDFVF